MGVVAAQAARCFNGVAAVRCFERGSAPVVTLQTQGLFLFREQVVRVGAVGPMAGAAPLLPDDRMDVLLLKVFPLVALITNVAAFGFQQERGLGRVGIVAERALSGLHGGMPFRPIQSDLVGRMAAQAERVAAFLLEEQSGDDAVPQVAVFAPFFFHDLVDGLHAEVLTGKLGVTIQALLARHLGGIAGRGGEHDAADEQRCTEDDGALVHG